MDTVYILNRVRSDNEYDDDAKLLGVYRSREAAAAAATRLSVQPGFREHPSGFQADAYALDQDHWPEAFGGALVKGEWR